MPETRHIADKPKLPYSAAEARMGWWLSSGIVGLGLFVAGLGGWWVSRDHPPDSPPTSSESSPPEESGAEP